MRCQRKTAVALSLALLLAACAGTAPDESGVVNGSVRTLMRMAEAVRESGDPASAVPLYRRAHDVSPQNVKVLRELGHTLNDLGAYAGAAEAWRTALAVAPHDMEALRGYGFTLAALGQPHLAMAKFRAALAQMPDAGAYNGMGVVQDMLGAPEDAQASYEAALAMAPDNLSYANNFGLSLALSGQHERAIDVLQGAADAPGATIEHRQNLALALGVAGKTMEAARIGRMDLDEEAVQNNLSYYAVLGALPDHAGKVAAVGTRQSRQLRIP